ncbi:hypothetical protein C1645_841155 [Glomus cerebriforme]|uniref:Uncharacterized protein n=1 Tax=Glomus cerebriforme TaxID=658196 RepID=A0A397S144_9GLOM|nr:hypothetical protein C1645_841155 [Glomus cerebriforme]
MPLSEEKKLKHDDPDICLVKIKLSKRICRTVYSLNWSNVFAADGAVLSYLQGLRKVREWYHDVAYKKSDINIVKEESYFTK